LAREVSSEVVERLKSSARLESQSLGLRNPEDNHNECKHVETGLLKEIVKNRVS
jgi:hypothetical protein